MEIGTKYKMELLGMVTALGCAHEKEKCEGCAIDLISRKENKMTIMIYYDDVLEPEKIQNVRGIAPDNEHDRLVIWYIKDGHNTFLDIKYTDYIRILIL